MFGGMRAFGTLLSLATFVVCCGCTRTYISTGDTGIPSPDGDTRLCFTAHGAYGHSYVDRTGKLFDVCIKRGSPTNETILFLHRYRFVGSDVSAAAVWRSTNEVTVQVYDYGKGVSRYDARETNAPSNHIATLSFHLDEKTGKFVEVK
jgi:hypothetical protein